MRLPSFTYLRPTTLDEALHLLHLHGRQCQVLAGGTDLLVRMKQRLTTPAFLMSLRDVADLDGISVSNQTLDIGAATPLARILASDIVARHLVGLAEAVTVVGAPSIQHQRGTLGGNLCQQTRCQFFNQSAFFRGVRQACHKAGGSTCYAREGGSDRCHSVCQSDCAPMLQALNARVTLKHKDGERSLGLGEFYTAVGEHPLNRGNDELVTVITVPLPPEGSGSAYEKLAYRSAIDYPVVSAAAAVQVVDGIVASATLVIGAVASAPVAIPRASEILVGKPFQGRQDLHLVAEAASNAAAAFVANNMAPPSDYRIRMVAVVAHRAMDRALSRAMATAV